MKQTFNSLSAGLKLKVFWLELACAMMPLTARTVEDVDHLVL